VPGDGQNKWNALLANRRLRSKGTLEAAQKEVWRSIRITSEARDRDLLDGEIESAQRWTSCFTQLIHAYHKLVVDGELEMRVKALEAAPSHNDKE
jgi:hypothetical protein